MKNIFKTLTCLALPFMILACSGGGQASKSASPEASSSAKASESKSSNTQASSKNSSAKPSSSSAKASSSISTPSIHTHTWADTWEYDSSTHWHPCTDPTCSGKSGTGVHVMSDKWEDFDPTLQKGETQTKPTGLKRKKCQTCDYFIVQENAVLPRLDFTFDPNDVNADFATKATKSDLSRPKVAGKFKLSNCSAYYTFSDVTGTMKVRGNQTAGWAKKGFKIKFDKGQSFLGLNGERKFKEWVLLADAKDTTLSRTALGLYVSRAVCKDDNQVWVSDFTPVNVYLNNQYWGYYYLAEQKEAKTGRVNIPILTGEVANSINIGYTFELDHYADSAGSQGEASEMAKGIDGDPTFRMKYSPRMEQGRPSGPLATGQVCTYTMLSDITDGPKGPDGVATEHWQADYSSVNNQGVPNSNAKQTSNSAQLTFIRDRMEALYQVLYYAAMENKAKDINDNNQIINTSKSVQEMMTKHFDLDAWVDGFIINAYSCPPDLGYSSFYMTFDNSSTGDKRLRYDVPWDFDSNFANRNNFIVNADQLYVDNTYNTWLYLLSKLSFFTDMVKTKWNKLRDDQVFEGMFRMIRSYYTAYDAEIRNNHQKWPQNDAAHQPPNNFDEIRNPYKEPSQYKDAEAETISWCAKRVNYLEKQWGNGHKDINPNA